ncbi:MAG: peptide deformylase [Peptococcaceae bacterium]
MGDPALRKVCKSVSGVTVHIIKILDDMKETLAAANNGAALAAPQVGILKKIVVIDSGEGMIELINPEIVAKSGEQLGAEACLSIPGIWGRVKRANYVKVKALNRAGEEFVIEGEEFMARCLQHEIDHLSGILFIDHVSPGEIFNEVTNDPLNIYELLKASKANL